MTSGAAPSTTRTLVRLKLRLIRNRGRRRGGKTPLVLGLIGTVVYGAFGFGLGAATSAAKPHDGTAILVIGATALVAGWTLFPLLAFGTDETLDPARLSLMPIPPDRLVKGLAVTALVGFAPVTAALAVAGVGTGWARGFGAPVVVAALVLLVALAVTSSRALATRMAASLTSRKGRDRAIIVGAVAVLGIQGLRFVRWSAIDPDVVDIGVDVLRWLPPGMLGHAVADARDGDVALALVELVPSIAAVAWLLRVWALALVRSTTEEGASTAPSKRRAAREARPALQLVAAWMRGLGTGPVAAVAAKELRYAARDPRRKLAVAQAAVLGIALPLFLGASGGAARPSSVLLATMVGYFAVLNSMNQFGFDGAALWVDVVAGNDVRSELVGKNVASVVLTLPVVLVGGVVLAVLGGGWLYVPAAIVLATAGLGAGLAVGNVVSVRYPVRLPETRSPFGGAGQGQGCVTGLTLMLCSLVQALLLSPIVISAAIALAVAPAALVVVCVAAVGYGWLLWRAGLASAVSYAWWRQAELVAAVHPRR